MVSLRSVLRDEAVYDFSLSEIVSKYREWVLDDRYMILNRIDLKTYKSEVFAVKCSKRGNDVYRSRVYRRFKGVSSLVENLVFFNPKDRGEKSTRALWVTLTYDVKRRKFKDAWREIGKEFNRFMSYVRKKFGKISCCRVFEAYENGHPHIHCILLFESTEFRVFRDKKGQFRVFEKEIIAKGWHSHVDVKAMSSLGRGFSYQKKYLLKSINAETTDSKTLKTLALCWLFSKRAFSLSGKFRQLLTDLIRDMHNSNRQLRQVTLTGGILVQEYKFYVLGFVPADVVLLKKVVWFKKLDSEQITSVEKSLKL